MHSDILSETLVLFSEAAKEFPNNPCKNTLRRWKNHGVNGVKLRVARSGRFLFTSKEEISRFLAAQNAPPARKPAAAKAQRQRRSEAASRVLEASGV